MCKKDRCGKTLTFVTYHPLQRISNVIIQKDLRDINCYYFTDRETGDWRVNSSQRVQLRPGLETQACMLLKLTLLPPRLIHLPKWKGPENHTRIKKVGNKFKNIKSLEFPKKIAMKKVTELKPRCFPLECWDLSSMYREYTNL